MGTDCKTNFASAQGPRPKIYREIIPHDTARVFILIDCTCFCTCRPPFVNVRTFALPNYSHFRPATFIVLHRRVYTNWKRGDQTVNHFSVNNKQIVAGHGECTASVRGLKVTSEVTLIINKCGGHGIHLVFVIVLPRVSWNGWCRHYIEATVGSVDIRESCINIICHRC